MIDKIFELILEEAKTRKGRDFSAQLFEVCNELEAKIRDKFEELNPDFMVRLPDDPEELAWNSEKAYKAEVKRRDDRRNLRNDHEGGQVQERSKP